MGVNIDVLLEEVEIVYQQLKHYSYPNLPMWRKGCDAYSKDNSCATEHRNRGNSVYRCCNDRQALEWYTNSIAWATDKSEELALAYANRSAALFRLGEYVPCLLDINRALKSDHYPERLRNKLRDRKKMCLLEIAKAGVKIASILNETDPIDSTMSLNNGSNVPKGNLDNPLLPNTSSKINLAYDEKWGRHMVAVKDIEPGEILSCEQFFITFLYSRKQYRHCSYCLLRCAALIPCPSCSQAMYCSRKCLTQAFDTYHRTECKIWPLFGKKSLTEEILRDALRMLFVGTEQGTKLRQLTASLSIRDIFKENVNPAAVNKPYASDYLSILQLRLTFDQPKADDILLAVKAVVWLQRCSFFENRPDSSSMIETEVFVTLALLNHLQSAYYNFVIDERVFVSNLSSHPKVEMSPIGNGILVLHSLLNHSCDPNVERVTTGEREQMMFSLRPIKRGEQIFTAYCTSFGTRLLAERKEDLSKFGFTCCCKACTNNWPLIDESAIQESINNRDVNVKIKATIIRMMLDGETNGKEFIRCRKFIHDHHIRSPSPFAVTCERMIFLHMMRTYASIKVHEAL